MVKGILISNSFTKKKKPSDKLHTIDKKYVYAYVCIGQMGFLSSIYPTKISKEIRAGMIRKGGV